MQTIEVEKKIRLESHQIQKITQKALLLKEVRIQDSYFDTTDYRYTVQNMWLRQRDEIFELKVGITKQNGSIDRYEEITDEKSILKHMGINSDGDLQSALSQAELSIFCSFFTRRRSYQCDDINIAIDEADFGDLCYHVAEIEVIVSDLSKVHEAEQKILLFAKEIDIDLSISVPAKLSYYLYCKRPEHYQALVRAKVIEPVL